MYKLFNKTVQKLSARLSKERPHSISKKGGPEAGPDLADARP